MSDSVLQLLFKDPRALLLYSAASEELWVASMRSLADVAEVEAVEFKSSAIAAAHLSYHFIWRKVLHTVTEYPWSLARGDIEENLIDLSDSDRPSEPMASQYWLSMQVRLNLPQLVETVQLLQERNWTPTIAEQQHGSLAALKRAHPEYHEDTLVARAQVLATRRLLLKPTEDEQLLARLI